MTVIMVSGLNYQSKRVIISIVFVDIMLVALSFVLVSYWNHIGSIITYNPGPYWTFPSGPQANLLEIGIGITLAAIVSLVFREELIRKNNVTV